MGFVVLRVRAGEEVALGRVNRGFSYFLVTNPCECFDNITFYAEER